MLNDETLQMLDDSVARYLSGEYDFDSRCKTIAQSPGYSKQHWQTFAELGWLAIPFRETYGGLDGNLLDCLGLMRGFGKALVVEPYTDTLAAGHLLQNCQAPQAESLITAITSGELIASLALEEINSRGNSAYVATTASKTSNGYKLQGEKRQAMYGPLANTLIISARLAGDVADCEGIGLFLVDTTQAGVSMTPYSSVDGHRAANITLDIELKSSALLTTDYSQLQQLTHETALLHYAEGLGAMETLLATTLEYTQMRKQFGSAIATFQAIQHRLADMYMAYHKANNLLTQTVADNPQGQLNECDIALLKAQFHKSARFIGQQSIQLHGGIGMTDELPVGHYFKRLTAITTLMGPADLQLKKIWAAT